MIVVADTSPINYLILIEAADVLQGLYSSVVVPNAVVQELLDARAPIAVRDWISNPPAWLKRHPDPPGDPTLAYLGKGQSAALTLAQILAADKLLIDERAGRVEAERRHLPATGLLGVLADAHVAGLLSLKEALRRLRATSFRFHADVERQLRLRILEEHE
jgi:predicted nucleic acid-binding protein